jgi:hypothetical protein
VIEQTPYGREIYIDREVSVKALPLAHRLHITLTGRETDFFKELFKDAARRCDIDWPQIEVMLESFDGSHVDPSLVDEANFRVKKHIIKYNRDKDWRVALAERPERYGATLQADPDG